ncbi:MAG: bifunctional oligoribonuclease/PAP phosphatase NrnA [Anaerolineae bacterium]|nr:MAG: bifunctional oligoribonuclease/PAP phosphatase NrnA [Anaerolineae bacterium]
MEHSLDEAIRQRLAESRDILIASHVRPDGDAIGSLIALGLALQNAGKNVQMVLSDGVPKSFRHLEGSEQVHTEPKGKFDTFIVVDCADFRRVGKCCQAYGQPDINIDHHVTNEKFGVLNLIEPQAVATSAILTDHLTAWGLKITQPIAAALLTGIVTDTLGFRTSNTTPRALRQAASLMEYGVNLSELYHRALVRRSFQAARYWGAGLSSLERSDGLVWGTLTLADRETSGYHGNDDADLINVLSAIDESTVAMIFVEQPDNHVKISWRALTPDVDVSRVAKHFGGGGHRAAAGADVPGSLKEVQPLVLKATREILGL